MRRNTGFTLIELMIVIAIIAILAAAAVPTFQGPIARAKVSEVVSQLGAAKTALAEYTATQGNFPLTANDAGIGTPGNAQYVDAVSWDKDQSLIAVKIKGVSDNINGKSLYFAAAKNEANEVFFACGSDADSKYYSYLPADCRKTLADAKTKVTADSSAKAK